MASGPLSIVKMTLSRSRADVPMQMPMHHPAFEPRRDIDAVAHQVAIALLDYVAQMDTDAELDAALGRQAWLYPTTSALLLVFAIGLIVAGVSVRWIVRVTLTRRPTVHLDRREPVWATSNASQGATSATQYLALDWVDIESVAETLTSPRPPSEIEVSAVTALVKTLGRYLKPL